MPFTVTAVIKVIEITFHSFLVRKLYETVEPTKIPTHSFTVPYIEIPILFFTPRSLFSSTTNPSGYPIQEQIFARAKIKSSSSFATAVGLLTGGTFNGSQEYDTTKVNLESLSTITIYNDNTANTSIEQEVRGVRNTSFGMAIKSAALADVVALVNETTTMPASPAIAALPAGAGEQIFVVATRPLGGSGLGFLQLPPLTTIFTTIKLGLCSLLPVSLFVCVSLYFRHLLSRPPTNHLSLQCLYRNLDTLVSAIRTKDSLNINIYGKSEWAHADSGASHNYMTEVKAKELQLKFKRHAGGKRIKVEVLMGTTRSTGSVKVPIGIMGEPEMDSIQEFFIVPDCVKPITMGGPWLLETKTLTQKHQYRFKASPISKSLGTILVYLLLFPFIMTGLLKIVNVFMCETAQCQATMKRLEIQLVGNDTSKPVYSIPDTGSSINCMPKSVADEMGYHIHRRWWKLTLVRNAVGHHFLADGIVEGKIRIGNFEEEHTVIWYVLKGINVHVLGRQFVKDKGVFEERYASAMKHDGGPKVHELFGLWKEPRPTAWIRHGWRKLWSRQKKEDS